MESEAALLGNEEQLPVCGIEKAVDHALGGRVDMDCDAGVHAEVAVAGEGSEPVDKIGWRSWKGEGIPAKLARCCLDFIEGAGADHAVGDALVGFVHDGGADAIGPGSPVEQSGRGKWAAAQLLGIEAKGSLLGGVLAHGKGAWLGLGGELVTEAAEVLEIGHDGPLWQR